jgi:hypothetical protein
MWFGRDGARGSNTMEVGFRRVKVERGGMRFGVDARGSASVAFVRLCTTLTITSSRSHALEGNAVTFQKLRDCELGDGSRGRPGFGSSAGLSSKEGLPCKQQGSMETVPVVQRDSVRGQR